MAHKLGQKAKAEGKAYIDICVVASVKNTRQAIRVKR